MAHPRDPSIRAVCIGYKILAFALRQRTGDHSPHPDAIICVRVINMFPCPIPQTPLSPVWMPSTDIRPNCKRSKTTPAFQSLGNCLPAHPYPAALTATLVRVAQVGVYCTYHPTNVNHPKMILIVFSGITARKLLCTL
jgi:hypothetical protein